MTKWETIDHKMRAYETNETKGAARRVKINAILFSLGAVGNYKLYVFLSC